MLPYTLPVSEEVLDRIEDATSWESLESIIQDKTVIESGKAIYEEMFDTFFPRDFTKAAQRSYFVDLVRTLYGISRSAQDKTFTDDYDPFYSHRTFFVDGITLHVRGICHDESELRTASKRLQKKEFLICEPGLNKHFKKTSNILELPRHLELQFLTGKEHLEYYYGSLPYGMMYSADPIGGRVKKGIDFFFKKKEEFETQEELKRDAYIFDHAPLPPFLERKACSYITDNGKKISYSNIIGFFRSFAQGEYAIQKAKEKGYTTVDLLVGANHAKDLQIIYSLPNMREKIRKDAKKRSDTYFAKQFQNIPGSRLQTELNLLHGSFWSVSLAELIYHALDYIVPFFS